MERIVSIENDPNANQNNNNTTGDTTVVNPANNNATNTNAPAGTTAVQTGNNAESDEDAIRNQKLVEEFQYLLEKSQSLFSGLR